VALPPFLFIGGSVSIAANVGGGGALAALPLTFVFLVALLPMLVVAARRWHCRCFCFLGGITLVVLSFFWQRRVDGIDIFVFLVVARWRCCFVSGAAVLLLFVALLLSLLVLSCCCCPHCWWRLLRCCCCCAVDCCVVVVVIIVFVLFLLCCCHRR